MSIYILKVHRAKCTYRGNTHLWFYGLSFFLLINLNSWPLASTSFLCFCQPVFLSISFLFLFLTFSGRVSGLEDELKHIKTSLSKAEAEKRQLQEDLTALEKVCVCVCGLARD